MQNGRSSGKGLKKSLLIVVVVVIAAIPLWVRQQSARAREMMAALQSSALLTQPVTVVASSKTSRSNEAPSVEALTLRDAGLLTIDYEPSTPAPPAPDPPLIRTMRRTDLARIIDSPIARLNPKDIAATRDWEPFEDPEHQRRGWVVPVGSRQLNEITSVEGADTDAARVHFTWYWKPNEVGQHFDINEETRKPGPRWKRKSHPELSSGYPFKGTAELSWTGAGWEVKSIKWDMTIPSVQ